MKKYWFAIIVALIVDRVAKVYVYNNPSYYGKDGFISFYLNKNVAFSIPLAESLLYPSIFLILIVLIVLWWENYKKKNHMMWPFAFMIVGAVSNLMDRFQYGGVIDFINVPYFTVLNLSDIYISLAAFYLIIAEFPGQKPRKKVL